MKNTLQLLIVLLVFASACNTTPKPKVKTIATETPVELSADVDLTKVELSVEGMTCQMGCAAAIKKKLKAVAGVQSAKVDFDNKLARIAFDPSLTNSEALSEAVTGAGKSYSVTDVNLVSEFTTAKSCKKECKKACCSKDKTTCKKECKKECCKDKAKMACQKDCKKACCNKESA